MPLLVALGLVVAALAQGMALFVAGAGHGWVTPFLYSPVLFLLYPIVLIRLYAPGKLPWRPLDLLLPAVAIILDVWLVRETRAEGLQYFRRAMAMPPLPHLWIAAWLGWQGLAVWRLVGGRRSPG